MEKDLFFSQDDLNSFRSWLGLNVHEMTWQGKNLNELEEFWSLLFEKDLTLSQLVVRINQTIVWVDSGPLASWLSWINHRLFVYSFINSDLTIHQLSIRGHNQIGEMARILRDYFIEFHPHLDDPLSETFQISHFIDEKSQYTFEQVTNKIGNLDISRGSKPDEIMISLEITLFESWPKLMARARKSFSPNSLTPQEAKQIIEGPGHLRLVRDAFVIVIVGVLLVFAIRWMNQRYEKFMTDSISIYEPQFEWLNKNLNFKSVEEINPQNVKIAVKDIDEVDDSQNPFGQILEDERFETESEVLVTSWDELPRDFDQANLEKSDYEEKNSQGYRENRYGNTKVYRVMMKAVDMVRTKANLKGLMDQYAVTQVDNVKPGMSVPGGMYFNLYVPREFLKEFIAQVMEVDDSILYESQARTYRNPAGKNRVFIWVKDI